MLAIDETSKLLGGKVGIKTLTLFPFSEIILTGLTLDSPDGERCAEISKVAAGIDLWQLLSSRKIVLNYAEIIGMDISVSQDSIGSPTSIQFLIDALSSKDKTKPPTIFNLKIRNVVIRNSKASFHREWLKDKSGKRSPFADLKIERLRMDLSIPALKNDDYRFNIRNMQFDVTPDVNVRSLTADIEYIKSDNPGDDRLIVKDFNIHFPHSFLTIDDLNLPLSNLTDIKTRIAGSVSPSDFCVFFPQLKVLDSPWDLNIAAYYSEKVISVDEFIL
ncbi:MAG: hypothetical protein K2G85_05665, partial [Muribaculaceae bacterium]|nr:hypothetical protein [Muribaculaceae bacterium]